MKRIFSTLYFVILFVNVASAQQEARFDKELKLNLNLMHSGEHWQLGPLAPVFTLVTNKHHRHDFELSSFRFSGSQTPQQAIAGRAYNTRNASYALSTRYQYTHSFLSGARLSPNLGASLESQWSYQSFARQGVRTFRYNEWVNNNFLELVPGLRWKLTELMGIDYGVAIPLLSHKFVHGRINSLAMGNRAYEYYAVMSDPFGFFRSRLGIYVKL